MKRIFFFCFIVMFIFNLKSYGQATRTWVSGVGDDVNPCSRTAPCKTFAGAISKTATGGEISILDPGGFGSVTIVKSTTIDGGGIKGSILASLTNGIIINNADAVVTIRNLSINGAGNGLNGIRIIAAKKVLIEDCIISNFTQKGVSLDQAVNCVLVMNNVTVHNTDDAISINSTTSTTVINNCIFQNMVNNGVNLMNGQVTVHSSVISDCKLAINAASNTAIRLSENTITANGTAFSGTGTINSIGNNNVSGNKTQGVNPVMIKQQ